MEKSVSTVKGDFSEEITQDKKKKKKREMNEDNHKSLIYWEGLRNKTRDRWTKWKILCHPRSSALASTKLTLEK